MPEGDLVFLHALTGLHPGSGAALDVIDLPVQRERHTNWPLVPGSSLKGVLRAATSHLPGSEHQAVFGPDTRNAADHAGAIALTDARLLAFPVRAVRGVFAWVTCPAILQRFARDARLAGLGADWPAVPEVGDAQILCDETHLVVAGDQVLLEEFDFVRTGAAGDWPDRIAAAAVDEVTGRRLRTHLAILSDNDFTHFASYATEVSARIGLDAETKTVRKGALFWQEVLPAETIFYALAIASDSRSRDFRASSADCLDWLRRAAPDIIQVGADETIGRGFCALRFAGGRG
ncbi:MAG: type III-B CRISPR module RAMP protein Cmr4 [Pseudomonadota bacterium]|nr:type III-B CRISPR module RAMP protein Cmr4 [Pseudomonadota bacterium]